MSPSQHTIEALFDEGRTFPPPPEFAAKAVVSSPSIYAESEDYESYWAAQAEQLVWRKHWDTVLDWSGAPFAKWFVGGKLNVTESCLDRHLADHAGRVAYYWEGEPGDRQGDHLRRAARRGVQAGERARRARRRQGRRRRRLHGPGARAPGRAAGVRTASGRRTRSCSAASPPRPSPTGSTTPRPRCSSPATAAGAAARSSR